MKSKASLAQQSPVWRAPLGLPSLSHCSLSSHSTHDMVLGGAAQAGSTELRHEQWVAAIPFIKSNPITGHGFAIGGYVIQSSIDSYVVSLLAETGIPDLYSSLGCSCFQSGTACGVTLRHVGIEPRPAR